MKQEDYKQVVLTADDGMVLTQSFLADNEKRIFSDKVFLAINGTPSDWTEWTIEKAEEYKAKSKIEP